MFSGHSWLTSYTAKLRKRSGSCHQSGRRRRDCSSLDWCSETQKAALPHPALVDLVFYFGIDPELLTPDKSGSLKLQKVTALTEQANSRLVSLDCVFDASLEPETCLEFPSLPV